MNHFYVKYIFGLILLNLMCTFFCLESEAGSFKVPSTIQTYFEDNIARLKIKECSQSQISDDSWPMKRVFIKIKPAVSIGINHVLSLTATPEISLGWEKVAHPNDEPHTQQNSLLAP